MASLTSLATFRRRLGSTSSARAPKSLLVEAGLAGVLEDGSCVGCVDEGDCVQLSRGTIKRAMARSRSFLNCRSNVAYGARFNWANSMALATAVESLVDEEKDVRISSTS